MAEGFIVTVVRNQLAYNVIAQVEHVKGVPVRIKFETHTPLETQQAADPLIRARWEQIHGARWGEPSFGYRYAPPKKKAL